MLELLGWLRGERLLVAGAEEAFTLAMRTKYAHEPVSSIMGPYCVACRQNLDETYTKHAIDVVKSRA